MPIRRIIFILIAIAVIIASGDWIYRQRHQFLPQPKVPPVNADPGVVYIDAGGPAQLAAIRSKESLLQTARDNFNLKHDSTVFPWSNGQIIDGLATFQDPGVKAEIEQGNTVKRLLVAKDFGGLEELASPLRSVSRCRAGAIRLPTSACRQ